MREQWVTFAAVLLTSASLSAAAPSSTRSHSVRSRAFNVSEAITWSRCPEVLNQTLTCANYTVPLDWNNPDGEKITLGMAKLAAKDPTRRIGYLLVHPGGPGLNAAGSLSVTARRPARLDPEILNRFDMIGLDGRGIGLSTPLQCDKDAFNKRVNYYAKTQEEFDEVVANNKAVAASCREKSGRLIDFMDTINTVKDIEAVRLALGGEKFNLAGLSYGSQLYAQYAELYPNSFRALLMDGALQHSQGEAANLLTEAATFEAALRIFLDWSQTDPESKLQGQNATAVFLKARDRARAAPITAPACDNTSCRSDVTEHDLLETIQEGIKNKVDWPAVAEAILDASNGDATAISSGSGLLQGNVYDDSLSYAQRAILCQDWTHDAKSVVDLRQKQAIGAAFAPLTTGHSLTYKLQTFCLGWPTKITNPPRPFNYNGSTLMLLVNSLYDPSTSYAWAVGMAGELQNTVLLTRNGAEHTSIYHRGGETAAAEAAYLLDLTMPAPGTVYDT